MNKTQLISAIHDRQSYLCVGLDPVLDRLPDSIDRSVSGVVEFNKRLIDATLPYCVAYKPNLAFFEALGIDGWRAFYETIQHIPDSHFVIADAKRGDIGNTSRAYAKAFFEQINVDALTIAPYMGRDSVEPFLGFPNKWAILLALTSNQGADDFQFRTDTIDQKPLYQAVIERAAEWGSSEELMFVVGATRPEHLAEIRKWVPDHFFLVPGVGAQGGDLAAVAKYGMNKDVGLLVNSSRGIIYASSGADFAEAAVHQAKVLQQQMAVTL